MSSRRLVGQHALITGAGSGIGRALAVEAASRGAAVALVGRHFDPLEQTSILLTSSANRLMVVADVTTMVGRQLIGDRVAATWGRLDLLVNNAGMVMAGPLSDVTDADLEHMIATNLSAPLALTRDLLPLLSASPQPRVVNIGSLAGEIALPFFTAYSASKYGLRGFSDALRRELRELGVAVTHVAPRGAKTAATAAVEGYVSMFRMTLDAPEAIAADIWSAVERGADVVHPRGRERFLALAERFCPRLVSRALASQLAGRGGGRVGPEYQQRILPHVFEP